MKRVPPGVRLQEASKELIRIATRIERTEAELSLFDHRMSVLKHNLKRRLCDLRAERARVKAKLRIAEATIRRDILNGKSNELERPEL